MSKSNKLDFIFYKNTLRTFLKEDGIKLWLEPYTNELNGFELEPFKVTLIFFTAPLIFNYFFIKFSISRN